jgi:outer membrane protein
MVDRVWRRWVQACAVVLTAGGLGSPGVLRAAPVDLVTGWQAALAHDPQYAQARAEHAAGQAKAEQGAAMWRPVVGLQLNAGWVDQQSDTRGAGFSAPGFGTVEDVSFRTHIDGGTAQGWGVSVQQPLLSGARSAQSNQLSLQAQLADEQWRQASQALMLRVAQAHFAVLAAREAVRASEAERDAAQRALGLAKESYDAGAVPITSVHEAQARHDAVQAGLLATQDALTLAQAAYTDLTGLPASDLMAARDDAGAPADAVGLEAWQARALAESPVLRSAELGEALARQGLKGQRWQSAASLDLVARASDDRMRGDGPYANSGSAHYSNSVRWVGLQFTMPLYTGGMRSAQEDEAAARVESAQAGQRLAREEVLRQTRAAWLAVRTGSAQVLAYAQARRSAAARLDATLTGLEAGDRTMLDRLDAERDLHASEQALLQARLQVMTGRLQLAAVAGVLDEAQLADVNASLTPSTAAP